MPTIPVVANTPFYVLMDGKHRLGPKILPSDSGVECTTIYAFSDKRPYDVFCTNSQLTLRPYPLVKAYLRDQVRETGKGLKLVVIDATGPLEPLLHAASMEAVLEAQENRSPHVTAEHRLVIDPEANAYRVNDNSVQLAASSITDGK